MPPSLSASILSAVLTGTTPVHDANALPKEVHFIAPEASVVLVENTQNTIHQIIQLVAPLYGRKYDLHTNNDGNKNSLSFIEEKVSLEIGTLKAQKIMDNIHVSGVSVTEETLMEEVLRQGREQIMHIFTTLENKRMNSKEWWKSLIELIAIINFFTVLPWAYSKTINGAKNWTGTSPVTFWAFTVSNGLGMAASIISGAPLLGAWYAIAFYSAIQTVRALISRKKLNERDKDELKKLQKTLVSLIEQNSDLTKQLQSQNLSVLDNKGNNIEIPAEYFKTYNAFSVYDMEGKALYFSEKLLNILGTTNEEVFLYQENHGEVVTLFYPDPEERDRIAAYQSDLRKDGQAYEETFFPRRVDTQKKLALHFNTIPRRNSAGEIIGTYRFAEDVTSDHRDNIDLLTGESDKMGFKKRFHDIALLKKQRKVDEEKTGILAIAYSDLDGFKRANDIYSHRNADVVLKEFVKMARVYFRSSDTIARLGGDEFWFVCDSCDKGMVLQKLNALRDELSRTTFEIVSGTLVPNGRKMSSSQEESLVYEKQRNWEIKQEMEAKGLIYDPQIHSCIGGIGISAGVTDFVYEQTPTKEEDVGKIFTILEQQCERVMGWAKKLNALGIGATTAKNAVGMAIVDDKWQVIGANIYSGERAEIFQIDRQQIQNESTSLASAIETSIKNR